MKKFVLFALALTMTVSAMATPTLTRSGMPATISQQQQPPPLSEPATAAYGDYYNEKDQAKKYEKAKAFLEKFASEPDYWLKSPRAFIQRYELLQVYNKCSEADKTFFGAPNEANLNNSLSACDPWLEKSPKPDPVYTTRMSLGTGFGVLAGFYKDTDRGMKYTEKALPLLASSTPPEGWQQKQWDDFRKENIGRLTQYQGLYKLRQANPDYAAAVKYLSDAAAIKEGPAYKDPNTYLLRAEAVTNEYTKLNAEYNALSDDDKRGEKGKAILAKINPVVSRLANDYARVVALTEGKPEFKEIYDSSKGQAAEFFKFLQPSKPEGVNELYTRYKADVGTADLEITAEESATPKTTPVGGKTAKAGTAGGAGGAMAGPSAGGEKAAPTKATPAKPAPKKRGR